jgi:hypothetical protein
VRRRHADVDDGDVRVVHGDVPQEILGVARLGADVEARVGEEPCDALPEQHRVVGEDDPDAGAERRDRVAERRKVARKVVRHQLVDPLWHGQALQAVLAELAQRHARELRHRLVRGDDLTSVARIRDPGCANDVDARVPLVSERRGSRVETDAHASGHAARPLGVPERSLGHERGLCSARRIGEDGDVLVADGVRLAPLVVRRGFAQEASHGADERGVVELRVLLQGGRALEVREEEGDPAFRTHTASLRIRAQEVAVCAPRLARHARTSSSCALRAAA